ncbi:MAG: CHAP domain-containing protein [Bacteroidota bacterium]
MKITEIALQEVGTKESPSGSNKTKYGAWFGLNGVAWCGIFVSWCYNQAGFPLGNIGYTKGYAGCQTALNHFKTSGEIVTKENVKSGDIVLFDWNNDNNCDHTGIFNMDLGNGYFQSIEGNTSLANQSNGGEVMIRKRSYAMVKAFVHPKTLDAISSEIPNV